MAWARRSSKGRSSLRPLVRGAAAAALVAAFVVPLTRKKLRTPATVTTAAVAAGPLALAVLYPRSRKRDAALYALQMWAFVMAHELPYDDPEAIRRRLGIRYPIRVDRAIGGGELPNTRLQRALERLPGRRVLDYTLSWVHWLWYFEPHLTMVWLLSRDNGRFPRAARQMAAVYDIGAVAYYAVPTAPPWWAAEQGYATEPVRRIMVEVGQEFWGPAWNRLYTSLGSNPWAAMPSLHFASSLMAAIHLAEGGRAEGAFGFGYAGALGFALVYLGEHYVVDLIAGAALVALVRAGEPLAEPAVVAVNGVLQQLERIANS